LRKNRILLIEDNPDHADLIINALNDEEAGNGDKDVFLIKDGQDAIDYFHNNYLPENACQAGFNSGQEYFQIELILLDINLPKVNGMDILKYIKKMPGYSETPVMEKLVSYDKLVETLNSMKNSFTKSYALT